MRKTVTDAAAARAELATEPTKPHWAASSHRLPFSDLTPDEFEIFIFLALLDREAPSKVVYFGKTGDRGRDIVIYPADKAPILVQCKHYKDNVGVGTVREELAKLVVNLHREIIPENPSTIRLYVTQDFTSDAIDLLQNKAKWTDVAEKAITEYLGHAPDAELLAFAATWWPEVELWNGVRITRLVRDDDVLLNEFFTLMQVITGSAAALQGQLDVIASAIQVANELAGARISDGMRQLVEQAQKENPGLKFEVSTTEAGTSITVTPSGIGAIPIGTLELPDTEGGRIGREKFRRLVEEGYPAVLEPNEFAWRTAIRIPAGLSPPRTEPSRLRLNPTPPTKRVPVKLKAVRGGKVVAQVDFTQFRIVRIGTKEFEVAFERGQLSGELSFVSNHVLNKHNVNFQLEIAGGKLSHVADTLRLLIELQMGCVFEVEALELASKLLEAETPVSIETAETRRLRNSLELVEKMLAIGKATNSELKYPEDAPEPWFVADIELLYRGVTQGVVKDQGATRVLQITVTPEQANQIADLLESNKAFAIPAEAVAGTQRFGDATLDIGPVLLTYEDVRVNRSAAELRTLATNAKVDETIELEIQSDSVIWEFPRYLPREEADPEPQR